MIDFDNPGTGNGCVLLAVYRKFPNRGAGRLGKTLGGRYH